jgi:hypothetical protein
MVAGRPKKQINEAKLRELAVAQCTHVEIAAGLGISVDTLDRNFADKVSQYAAEGRAVLRVAQWKKAIKSGDCQMLKYLGRFYLGQREELVLTTEEPSVRKLLNQWEGHGTKINTDNVVIK